MFRRLKKDTGSSGRVQSGTLKLDHLKDDLPFAMAGVLLFSFLLSFAVHSLMVQPQDGKAANGLGLAENSSMTLKSSASEVNMNITPTPGGALSAGAHTLTASTNAPTGYNLSIAASGTPAINPINGTLSAPAALSNNTWGFALNRVSSGSAANTITNGFDDSYTTPTPNAASKWANPSASTMIKKTTQAAAGDTTTVYYGAKINMDLPAGSYSNTVRYTAVANLNDIPTPSINTVTPYIGSTAGGTAIQIVGKGFTVKDQSVTTAVTVGGAACTDVSISSNTPTTGQDTIYCNTPAGSVGAKDVEVNTWGGTAEKTGGFTYVAPAAVSFVSPSIASTIAGTESGPAFTIVGKGFTGASGVTIGGAACASFTVVSDTQIFCQAPDTIRTVGNRAIVVSKSDVASNNSVAVSYSGTDYPTLQSGNAYAACSTTPKIFRDTRDSQLYYVKKMPDEKCWMVDNLKYAGYGDLHTEDGKFLTADGTSTQSSANSDVAKYVDVGATDYCTGNANVPTSTNTRCGLLYNWYAATAGTGTYALSTQGNQASDSICPANFRLPSATSNGTTATSNGTSYTAADFPVLNASMKAGSLATGSISNFPTGWQPSGAWGGMFSGNWYSGLGSQDSNGFYWSSTANSSFDALGLSFSSTNVSSGRSVNGKNYGRAVRCVLDAPPTPPAGTTPPNISSTNPAVLDVYPTTGWTGDVVSITSNALFTDVTGVTIGGVACSKYGIISASLLTCVLPAKTAGTSNNIAVINDGANITDSSTYSHMKITYFNPGTNSVAINGTTYKYFPNGFTNSNCSALTASNSSNMALPNSIAYFRDTRNKQTYKVKKMADNKCWMVDNLKYIDTAIANTSDGSTGMTYNQGDHKANGGTSAYNTVDESSTQSSANSNKAFYNNPMSNSYCYGKTNMPAQTLTNCGYLYNWYAATAGTGTYALSTQGNQASDSICPANFRLPSAMSDGTTATSNGTSYNAADFPVLNASMNAGSLATGSTSNYPANWQPSGAWGGMFSGDWNSGLGYQGSLGYYWSSTADSSTSARNLYFLSSYVNPGNNLYNKFYGRAVRCVLP